jgi:hypothetical protein
MGGRRSEVWLRVVGMALVALSLLVACGDDDGGSPGAPDLADGGGDGDGAVSDPLGAGDGGVAEDVPPDAPGVVLGACDLLAVAEIEAELGDVLGPVRDGEVNLAGCLWPIGQDNVQIAGLDLQILYHPSDELADDFAGGSPEAALADVQGVPEVPGLGDEARLSYGTLYVRSGDTVVSLSLESFAGADAFVVELVALAEQLVARL